MNHTTGTLESRATNLSEEISREGKAGVLLSMAGTKLTEIFQFRTVCKS